MKKFVFRLFYSWKGRDAVEMRTVEAESMRVATVALRCALLDTLPPDATTRKPLTIKAYGSIDNPSPVALDGENLFWCAAHYPKMRKIAEFRVLIK